jgi:lysophospholipase L1-like esterase
MPAKKLPLWKTVLFSLIPAFLVFVVIEGGARIIWHQLEAEAAAKNPNKEINFSEKFDPVLGYRLAPNYQTKEGNYTSDIGRFHFNFPMLLYINGQGFFQRSEVTPEKKPGSLRIVTIGESTTQGHHVDQNYPSVLRDMLQKDNRYPGGIDMINAGVPGYVSDQWRLYAERELAVLKPDVVIFYAGWNDFQSYNPHAAPPQSSYFAFAYGYLPGPARWLKSVTLLGALLGKLEGDAASADAAHKKLDIDDALKSNDLGALQAGLEELKAKRQRYQEKMESLQAQSQPDADKISKRKTAIQGFDAQIQEASTKLKLLEVDPAAQIDARALYKFYLINLDRTVAAFKAQNPNVRIVISTLVGRWPYESEDYFRDGNNSIWWMKTGHDTSKTAVEHLDRFNALIRDYAKENGWVLIDSANSFASVRREEIQWDFAHFTDVGYRMLAETIYHGLHDHEVVQ